MPLAALTLLTMLPFLVVDVIWLRLVMRPLFEARVGDLLRAEPRLDGAAAFYLLYSFAVVWFAALPGFREGSPAHAALQGALVGLLAFGTYETTNLATLKGWSWTLVLADTGWGMALTAASAAFGVWAARALFP